MESSDDLMIVEKNDQTCIMSDNAHSKTKSRRTPLKQHPTPRPAAPLPSTPLRRRRKRIGGKRTVRSCTSCRAAHVRCVADRYGVPCERCAKKSWMDCTLMQNQPDQAPKTTPAGQTDQREAADTADTVSTVDTTDTISISDIDTTDSTATTDTANTNATDMTDAADPIDPSSPHAYILKQIASDTLAAMTEEENSESSQETPGCTTQ
ncbi:hypothetical protein F5Y10DRAFT_273018 [Nemania abortiva]|nr:hypothetical protein F5Y10DRAFT_273018 [Nemania abortiva]